MDGPDKGHLVCFIHTGPWLKVVYASDAFRTLSQLQKGNPHSLRLFLTFDHETRAEAMKEKSEWLSWLHGDPNKDWVELEKDPNRYTGGPIRSFSFDEVAARPYSEKGHLLGDLKGFGYVPKRVNGSEVVD